jgi:hypothetical protein
MNGDQRTLRKRQRVRSGNLRLHGAWFAIASGELMLLQPDGSFAAA